MNKTTPVTHQRQTATQNPGTEKHCYWNRSRYFTSKLGTNGYSKQAALMGHRVRDILAVPLLHETRRTTFVETVLLYLLIS